MDDVKQLVSRLTLEEKASLCSGLDFWHTKGVQRLGIAPVMLTDGPHGLRKQEQKSDHMGLNKSVPATCFPTASATACSWDRELMREIGVALGEECIRHDVAVLLGPGANIKRSPLCGRNFEYISEDPYLTGEMAAALIQGIQSMGVGTSLKHYALNNQEDRRMTINAVVDERTLREIYLAGFEKAVKQSQPWTVMCAYNRVNGTYCSENNKLLNDILRDEWGFEGLVVTDWGACNDRVEGLAAGQDLEMPASGGMNDRLIIEAVQAGRLSKAALDKAVERVLSMVLRWAEHKEAACDMDAHHLLARRAAAQSAVLLKMEGSILPLSRGGNIAVIGEFAKKPRYQGSGSSLINPARLECAFDEILSYAPDAVYAAGYSVASDEPQEELIREACEAASRADVAVIFVGLPNSYESEGFDREHMRLPGAHTALIEQVAKANPNTVVVLSNGSPVEMPWLAEVKAVLEGYLGGQAGGGALADVLFGVVNPSGKLAETFPVKLQDVLASKYFPMGPKAVEYREGLFVGYRWFDASGKVPLFPFGHGLSYTTFEYSELKVEREHVAAGEEVSVSLTVRNNGSAAGQETVQLYVRDVQSTVFRPEKELKGFCKVQLATGEEKRITFTLDKRAFAFYNTEISAWQVESGEFELLAGASSVDIRLKGKVFVESCEMPLPDLCQSAVYFDIKSAEQGIPDGDFEALYGKVPQQNKRLPGELYDINSTIGDFKATFTGKVLHQMVLYGMNKILGGGDNGGMRRMVIRMVDYMPLRSLVLMSQGKFSHATAEALLLIMNKRRLKGVGCLVWSFAGKK